MTDTAPRIQGVHHSAFRCRDAAETRAFYEGILGLTLKAALAFEKDPSGADRPYMHLFFEMADKNFIAFFDLPHTVDEARYALRDGMEDCHIAMELSSWDAMTAMKARLERHGIPVFGPIDHHFCHSIYFWDPNGINLEFTIRDAKHDAILAEEAASADAVMAKWATETAAVRTERLKGTEAARAATEGMKAAIAKMANDAIAKAGRASAAE
ncbi:MAG: VOC family protein [Alphaproteobacteria bacterium]|nr:VOC family protein [Alphaproteobacteria bacterium]